MHMILLLRSYTDFFSNFAVIRPGKDTEWSYINFNLADDYEFRRFHEVVHLGDKFYCLHNDDRILSFDARDTIELSEIISELEVKWGSLTPMEGFGSQSRANKTYIVDSNEKGFLIVKRYKIWEGNWPDEKAVTFKFEIFELNFDKHELIEKETLDDAALFLGDNSSMFVLASKLPGCQPNCIYFTSDYQRSSWVLEDFGVYNIKTQSISKPYTTTAMTLLARTKQPEIWVMPTCRQ
ncbi:PREDICTED: F-box [Prunus dulcis]|uniref:PREDICTED: F-box n=1 Tax=Prunus dulcis TaxID=3755 RepID=A0A5E4FRB5_PRUDU|nr:putative F-box protein At2g16290 [Prunus dulcis]VVA30049.1 PREDICTED: F-box [Prunus dulcis]